MGPRQLPNLHQLHRVWPPALAPRQLALLRVLRMLCLR
jgi:hypothetical protein